jgi:citronellol/citronellal dehydrogenase
MTDKTLAGKTMFVSGASRGIGLAIALRAARDGANVAIAAKTDKPHPKLPGTIHTAAQEIADAGGTPLPLVCDVREEEQVRDAVVKTAETFGGIDICVNNASAIQLTGALDTDMKRYDLMHSVGPRASFMVSKYCLPHLLKAERPHILMLSPPLHLKAEWFGAHVAYTYAKFGMSLLALGLSEEFKGKVAVNALWPRTTIATAAIANIVGGEDMMAKSRKPEIMADAAYLIVTKPVEFSGQFLLDETVLANHGMVDLRPYDVTPGGELQDDLFVDPDSAGLQNAVQMGTRPG